MEELKSQVLIKYKNDNNSHFIYINTNEYGVIYNEENYTVTLRVLINPLVGLAWMALPIFTLGVGVSLTYRPKSLVAREAILRERYLVAQNTNT